MTVDAVAHGSSWASKEVGKGHGVHRTATQNSMPKQSGDKPPMLLPSTRALTLSLHWRSSTVSAHLWVIADGPEGVFLLWLDWVCPKDGRGEELVSTAAHDWGQVPVTAVVHAAAT